MKDLANPSDNYLQITFNAYDNMYAYVLILKIYTTYSVLQYIIAG